MFAAPLHITNPVTKERDARFLNGGNFFGKEAVAPPPLEPLASDFIEQEMPPAPPGKAAASSGGGAPLILKLPTGKGKSPQ